MNLKKLLSPSEPPTKTREKIIEAAAKLFADKGYNGVSVREIARASRTNLCLVSYYFDGKEGLYLTILREHAEKMITQMGEAITSAPEEITREKFLTTLDAIIDRVIEMRLGHPIMAKVIQRESLDGFPFGDEIHKEVIEPVANKFFAFFEEAQRKKIVKPDIHPKIFFCLLHEGIWGYLLNQEHKQKSLFFNNFEFPKDKERLKKNIFSIFVNGVLL